MMAWVAVPLSTVKVSASPMAERIPGGELFEIRGGSHAAPVEQPIAVQLRVDKFLLDHSL